MNYVNDCSNFGIRKSLCSRQFVAANIITIINFAGRRPQIKQTINSAAISDVNLSLQRQVALLAHCQ